MILSKIKKGNLFILGILFTSMIFFACNASENKKPETTEATVNTETKTAIDSEGLKQNGDYSSLFSINTKKCDFLSIPEFAAAINVSEKQISLKDNGYACTYIFTDDKGLATRFMIENIPAKKEEIQKDIKQSIEDKATFKEGSRLVDVRKSKTGDTYLLMNQDRRITIMNDNYTSFTSVLYVPEFDPNEKDVAFIDTKKDEMREKAFDLANALLEKYKK